MCCIDFQSFVEKVCQTLEAVSASAPHRIAACKSGEDFEACVVEAVYTSLDDLGLTANVHYTPGGHAFPDVVIEFSDGKKYGIEVKSSTSATSKSWKINGNSVLGSTKENVIDTYIVFGKTAMGNQAFRFKRYEDAVANVAVTHSPRYAIDMDIAPGETFFDKSGLSYKQISEAENPIGLITTYFKSQGQRAWWLAESTPAAIRMFAELSAQEQSELLGYCFAHFPEVLSNSSQKFHRSAMWLVTDRSVVSSSLRDSFTAGGRVDIETYGATYKNLPQIFNNLRNYRSAFINALEDASIDELREDWDYGLPIQDTLAAKLKAWISVASNKFTSKSVNGYDKEKLLSDVITT